MEPQLNVALCIRSNWKDQPGGDVTQLLKTKEALEANHPVQIAIVDSLESPELNSADIVHVFNVQQPEIGLPYLKTARERGKKTALSTIFWDLSHAHYAMVLNRLGLEACRWGFFKPLACGVFGLMSKPDYFSSASRARVLEMIDHADVLLPNSAEEGEMVARYVGKPASSWHIAPVVNAVDASIFTTEGAEDRQGVIQAGNFEAVKNHMATLREDIPVTFVGNPTNPSYVARLKAKSGSNVTVLDRSVGPAELAALYRKHRVHANPSFRESPGLATMEALACGCRVVVADAPFCPVQTYFGELIGKAVFVCDPYSRASVRRAIDQAAASTSEVDLTPWLARFSWKETARQTFEAYRKVLDSKGHGV